jgi:hypothetical protein
VLRDLLAAHHAILVEHQELEQGVFLGGEADGPAGARHRVAAGIQGEIGHLHHLGAQTLGPPQQGAQAGQQLFEVEGLGEVIVGAGIEPGHAVVHRGAGGEHEDGRAETGGAQFAADGVAVLHRQHHVQNHQVVLVHGGVVDGLLAVGRDVDGVGLFAQTSGDERSPRGIRLPPAEFALLSIFSHETCCDSVTDMAFVAALVIGLMAHILIGIFRTVCWRRNCLANRA